MTPDGNPCTVKFPSWVSSPSSTQGWTTATHLCGRDVYFDTSFGYGSMPRYYAEQILERHGTHRILFGTDSPWHTAPMEWRMLDTLGLTDLQREQIACGNAKQLLGIE